ncbi:MAG: BatD family protein [Methylacidiphilales bacterium]|nr:BatD family protein [Candidatus Methylacidiphilales bacterium]
MKPAFDFRLFPRGLVLLLAWMVLAALPSRAAVSLSQQIDQPEANVGDEVTVTFTIQGVRTDMNFPDIQFPKVAGLQVLGTSQATNITIVNGSFTGSISESFHISASRPGNYVIPSFDISTPDGGVLHTQPINLHILDNSNAPPSAVPTQAPTPPPQVVTTPVLPNNNGPVVMPPNNGGVTPPANPNQGTSSISVPTEPGGRPARVFLAISPTTTDAYVGESIPVRIEFYIRYDSDAQQNSLPTIRGSDFLMNNLSVHPMEEDVLVMNEPYRRESWLTAISAPKGGDFPLQMDHDTYWSKPVQAPNNFPDPFVSMFLARPQLVHQNIVSNQAMIHVHELPQEGRPANFTGAIGHLLASGTAQPSSVTVGEPVTLHFTISGEGNFDYVRSPALTPDPNWKSYVPRAKMQYDDESHTQGTKIFDQEIIPQKNGTLPLPAANFSYFDPNTKQYVTQSVALPSITVTGSMPVATTETPAANDTTTATPFAPAAGIIPNRIELGSLSENLTPAYRQPWFWTVQGGLAALVVLGVVLAIIRARGKPNPDHAERALRERTLHQEEDAMSDAVRRNDSAAFFLAARHTIQLQLGARWRVKPEALTLTEIRQRDPELAETLTPLFAQADEVIYSGRASGEIDLAQWEQHVRRELLQAQPA